jgi:regulatory protein
MKRLTPTEARKKIYRYCAYQERCHQEVKDKLYEFGLSSADVDEVLVHLIQENFLNEERFARAFAGGKFRLKKWGRLRIVRELEARDVSRNCIRLALQEIDEADYHATLRELLDKKKLALEEPDTFVRNDKASRYAIQKGYEPDLVWSILKNR